MLGRLSSKPDVLAGVLFLLTWSACLMVRGQVTVVGRHSPSFSLPLDDASELDFPIPKKAFYRLPNQDNHRFLRLAQIEEDQGLQKPPYKFAQAIVYELDAKRAGVWSVDRDRKLLIWRALLQSPGAKSIGLNFRKFNLPPDAELYLIGNGEVVGAYTALNNKPDGTFAVAPLAGDSVLLEYLEPITLPEKEETANILPTASTKMELQIQSVVHGFREGPKIVKAAGSCNIDVACPQGNGLRDQINSVGIFITDNGQRLCSGTVLNNPHQDGRQLFITAYHCIVDSPDVSNYIVGFNYQFKQCVSGGAPTPNRAPMMQSVQGMKLLAKWDKSDFALLEILEPIPDSYRVFYTGWTRLNVAPHNVSAIHHPSGDVKKVSRFFSACRPGSWSEAPRTYHWMVDRWTEGVTEPGSSGSGLFNDRGRFVGHLHGGQSSCDNRDGYDLYGALAADWDTNPDSTGHLSPYLDPDRRGVLGMSGSYYVSSKAIDAKDDNIKPLKRPVFEATIEYREKPLDLDDATIDKAFKGKMLFHPML